MSHFAKVKGTEVVKVIVAEQEFIDNYYDEQPGDWIQCSYNTRGGSHYVDGDFNTLSDTQEKALRYNYPGVGWKYDKDADAFYAPQPYPSWTLNTETYLWEAPVAYPDDGELYTWNEETQSWDAVTE